MTTKPSPACSRPEFRNRLDATIAFGHLPPEIVRKVVEKFILQLEAQLSERQINIELSTEAADWLAKKGYDQQMGARPLARVIQEHIKKPLAEEVLFGKLTKGGTVRILLKGDELAFQYLGQGRGKILPQSPRSASHCPATRQRLIRKPSPRRRRNLPRRSNPSHSPQD